MRILFLITVFVACVGATRPATPQTVEPSADAIRACEEALDLRCLLEATMSAADQAGDKKDTVIRIIVAGGLLRLGHRAAGLKIYADAAKLALSAEPDHRFGRLRSIAMFQQSAGDSTGAQATLTYAVEAARALEKPNDVVRDLFRIARVQARIGDMARTRSLIVEALDRAIMIGGPRHQAVALLGFGQVAREAENLAELEIAWERTRRALRGIPSDQRASILRLPTDVVSWLLRSGRGEEAIDLLDFVAYDQRLWVTCLLSAIEDSPKGLAPDTRILLLEAIAQISVEVSGSRGGYFVLPDIARVQGRLGDETEALKTLATAKKLALAELAGTGPVNALLQIADGEAQLGQLTLAQATVAAAFTAVEPLIPQMTDQQTWILEEIAKVATKLQLVDLAGDALDLAVRAATEMDSKVMSMMRSSRIAEIARLQATAGFIERAESTMKAAIELAGPAKAGAGGDRQNGYIPVVAIGRAGAAAAAFRVLERMRGTTMDDADYATIALAEIAIDRWRGGDTTAAQEALLRAVTSAQTINARTNRIWATAPVRAWLELGFAQGLLGNMPAAMESLKQAVRMATRLDSPADRASALNYAIPYLQAFQANKLDPQLISFLGEDWRSQSPNP